MAMRMPVLLSCHFQEDELFEIKGSSHKCPNLTPSLIITAEFVGVSQVSINGPDEVQRLYVFGFLMWGKFYDGMGIVLAMWEWE